MKYHISEFTIENEIKKLTLCGTSIAVVHPTYSNGNIYENKSNNWTNNDTDATAISNNSYYMKKKK